MALDIFGSVTSLMGPDKVKVKYPKALDINTELQKILGAGETFQPQFQQLGLDAYQQFGPQYAESYWQQNPLLAQLLQQTSDVVGGMPLTGELSAPDVRRSVQLTRGRQSAAGFGQGSNRDRFEEAVNLATQSEQLRQQRMQQYLGAAMNLLGITKQVSPDTMGATYSGLGGQFASQLFPTATDITSLNYNAKLDKARAAENYNLAERAGYRQMVGQIVGGAMGMGGGMI